MVFKRIGSLRKQAEGLGITGTVPEPQGHHKKPSFLPLHLSINGGPIDFKVLVQQRAFWVAMNRMHSLTEYRRNALLIFQQCTKNFSLLEERVIETPSSLHQDRTEEEGKIKQATKFPPFNIRLQLRVKSGTMKCFCNMITFIEI